MSYKRYILPEYDWKKIEWDWIIHLQKHVDDIQRLLSLYWININKIIWTESALVAMWEMNKWNKVYEFIHNTKKMTATLTSKSIQDITDLATNEIFK